MNLQYGSKLDPLRVLIVNPLSATAQLIVCKILTGQIFGKDLLVDVILLVYSNEVAAAEALKYQLEICAPACINSIKISSDLPSVSDADVFCIITNFLNPNEFVEESMNDDKQFDAMYLIIKIANSLRGSVKEAEMNETSQKHVQLKRNDIFLEKKARKPIFIADGLVAIDVLMSLSQNLPYEVFFCPTPLEAIAKSVLADHLKVKCNMLNDALVWAANDRIFHVDFEKPLILHDKVEDNSSCGWDLISKDILSSTKLDHTQFGEAWLKKELLQKSLAKSVKNPYGNIYKAAAFAQTLKDIWMTRSCNEQKLHTNVGVISDGSLETIKGCAYVLPIIITGDTWTVNTRFQEDCHLKLEIRRMNKSVRESHGKLISFCKKFLKENVIEHAFAVDSDGDSVSSLVTGSNCSGPSSARGSTDVI